MNLKASFGLPVETIDVLLTIMARRTKEPHRLTIFASSVPNNCHVVGAAQDVMFFIGDLAGHGFDELFSVTAHSSSAL